jgi:predicted NUDIX family NTP pyrophosphohydrolase
VHGDIDPASIKSNVFSMEWPPRSGTEQQFPEVDRGQWFTVSEASAKLLRGQRGFLEELQRKLAAPNLCA